MEDAQMTLPIEEELVGDRLGTGKAGQRDSPGLPLTDARGHPHAIRILWPVLGNGRDGALVKVQRVLSDPPQHLEPSAALLEESGEELRVASSVGKAREAEVAPGIDSPAAVAIVDHFHRRAVRPREVRMELRASPKRLHCSGILAVLRIEGDPGEGEVVVARGGARHRYARPSIRPAPALGRRIVASRDAPAPPTRRCRRRSPPGTRSTARARSDWSTSRGKATGSAG